MTGQSTYLWFNCEEDARAFFQSFVEGKHAMNEIGCGITHQQVLLHGKMKNKPVFVRQYGVVIHTRPMFDEPKKKKKE